MNAPLENKIGQPSWRMATKSVEAFVTETGGHLGPVTFQIGGRKIQPFAVAPWAEENTDPSLPPMLKVLRGDFFCLPFGGNATAFEGERHPPHGETANRKWLLESAAPDELHLSMKTKVRRGRVDKHVCLRAGHSAVYERHIVGGMGGPMNPGHHAMLKFPDAPGAGHISTSRFTRGDIVPVPVENPTERSDSCLKAGGTFRSLEKVPLADGGWTDVSVYPARRGFEDIVMLTSDPRQSFAWTAVTFPGQGYVWFALKDPRVLRQTILWLSNGGRHFPPWNGRHVNVMGLEEVTSWFHFGLAESAAGNPLSDRKIPTCLRLDAERPLTVNYIMAVAAVPEDFDRVASITPAMDGRSVDLTSLSGRACSAPLDLDFLELAQLTSSPVT